MGKINALERATEACTRLVTDATQADKASDDVANLAKRVEKIDGSHFDSRLATMENRLEDVQAENEAMTLQISSLSRDEAAAEDERVKALTKEKALLKRVGEVEENLRAYEQRLEQVGKRVNEGQLGAIRAQLEGLTTQVRREGEGMKRLSDSLSVLESANTELVKANERLADEVKTLAERRASTSARASVTRNGLDAETPDHVIVAKKSHKWAGGGADRDIIQQGSGSRVQKARTTPKATLTKSVQSQSSSNNARRGQFQKTSQGPKKSAASSSHSVTKSHKWVGGGADKDILRQGADLFRGATKKKVASKPEPPKKPEVKAKPIKKEPAPKPPKPAALPAKKQPKIFEGDKNRPIIRQGKGWVEYAYTPTDEELSQESAEPVKRPRGRPRKSEASHASVAELEADEQLTRHAGQLKPSKSAANLKKRTWNDDDELAISHNFQPSKSMKDVTAAQHKHSAAGEESKQRGIFSSPESSPSTTHQSPHPRASKDSLLGTFASQSQPGAQEEPAPKRRRVIEQSDDSGLLEQYQGAW